MDTSALRSVAGQLSKASSAAASAGPIASADAGRSSNEVAAAVEYLRLHADKLARSLGNAAAALTGSADAYDAQDAAAAASFKGPG